MSDDEIVPCGCGECTVDGTTWLVVGPDAHMNSMGKVFAQWGPFESLAAARSFAQSGEGRHVAPSHWCY